MKAHPKSLSLIIPAYNEATHVEEAAKKYIDFIENLCRKNLIAEYEVLIVFNGCTDGSDQLLKNVNSAGSKLRIESIAERGLGLAIKRGIEKSSFELGMFYSVDIPFGLEVIESSLREFYKSEKIGMIIGSKGHPQSRVARPPLRRFVSFILNFLLKVFFKLNIKDTQGSQLFRNDILKDALEELQSSGPFLQVELILALQKRGFEIKEVPITYIEKGRPSKMKIFKDAFRSLKDLSVQALKGKKNN